MTAHTKTTHTFWDTGQGALPMIKMLMRKTMMKKIHMKKRSMTLATFFHSAPFAHVALCSRKQLAMYSTFLISLSWCPQTHAYATAFSGQHSSSFGQPSRSPMDL
ncbi:hypothetical protein JZ751_006096 [Albula glossodonta]|uniref:Uncharacterized protein n=1 Tax=Albula glossodonta TaxID=121402 RepID=A0A8T2P4F5_9TELE|nr:hypothetical protein JZ751_006096 [Albula glossodonta]